MSLERKNADLLANLRDLPSILVCYSGGVDSSFLLAAAVRARADTCLALTTVSPSLPPEDLQAAQALAVQLGARHLVQPSLELSSGDYTDNPTNRCYFCKTELLRIARRVARQEAIEHIALGTNADELTGHRPGLKAANEAQAIHPLAEVGLSKDEIRELSRRAGLPTWDKPQAPCLASRFPYGTRITQERLSRIGRFEREVRELGFSTFRVRFHEPIARIEVPPEQMSRAIDPSVGGKLVEIGQRLGFNYVALDLAGYRSGSLNEMVATDEVAVDAEAVSVALSLGKT